MPVVVVTGASHGIGRAIALSFASEDQARLVLVSRNEEKLADVADECARRGADTIVMPCDVTDVAAVNEVAEAVIDEWSAPDVLVNNAGLFKPSVVEETSPEDFREQVDVNLNSAFYLTRAFLPAMLARRSGHIFFMASVASIKSYPGGVAYSAAKHGMLGLARTLREETRERGIRVTSVVPGATFTPSWEGTDLPEERFMPPGDIAAAVMNAWKLSDRTVMEEVILRPQLGDI